MWGLHKFRRLCSTLRYFPSPHWWKIFMDPYGNPREREETWTKSLCHRSMTWLFCKYCNFLWSPSLQTCSRLRRAPLVGCHLSTHLLWSTWLVSVCGRCNKGGAQSLQLETPICRKYKSWWWATFCIMTGVSVSHLIHRGHQKLEFSVVQEHCWG